MDLTPEMLEIAFGAWCAAQDGGKGVVLEPSAHPAAHALAERGWLERRFVVADHSGSVN
jgi:hypothetical protein